MTNEFIFPEKSKLKKYKIIAFDTEDDSFGNVLLCDFYDGEKHFTFTDMDLAIDHIYNNYDNKDVILYALNLEYDLLNVFKKNLFLLTFNKIGNRLISAKLDGVRCKFFDVSNIYKTNLKTIGKLIGSEKKEIKYDKKSLLSKKGIAYLHQDTKIVFDFMTYFQTLLNDSKLNLKATIGSIAMDAFKSNFLFETMKTLNSDYCLQSFFGGRTEAYFKGEIKIKDGIYESDINSLYPYVMLSQNYPDVSEVSYSENIPVKDLFKFLGVVKATVENNCDYPVLACKIGGSKNKKLFFPNGQFEGFFNLNELQYMVKNKYGKVLKIHSGYITKKAFNPFSKFVEFYYKKRLESKNEFEKLFFKLVLNNLYGKFISTHGLKEIKVSNRCVVSEKEKSGSQSVNFILGTYITSYARIESHKRLMELKNKGCKIYYTDTDSFFYSGKKFWNDSKELGGIKTDVWSKLKMIQPKLYILSGKKVIDGKNKIVEKTAGKGIPKKLIKEYINKGIISFKKPIRLNEGISILNKSTQEQKEKLFEQNIGFEEKYNSMELFNYWLIRTKERNETPVEKRKFKKDGFSEPLKYSELIK